MKGAEDWTFWLMMTNLALAAVVLVSALIVFVAVMREFFAGKARQARQMSAMDEELSAMLREESHRIHVPELGWTMADGGEELDPVDKTRK